jgi:hypothetical protein
MEHAAIEQPQSPEPPRVDAAETDKSEPEFESLMLPEIVEMPKLSDLPRWLRSPLERLKRSR